MQPNGLPNVGLIRDSVGNTIQRVGKVRSDDRRYGGTENVGTEPKGIGNEKVGRKSEGSGNEKGSERNLQELAAVRKVGSGRIAPPGRRREVGKQEKRR